MVAAGGPATVTDIGVAVAEQLVPLETVRLMVAVAYTFIDRVVAPVLQW